MKYAIGVLNKIIKDIKKETDTLECNKIEYGLDYPKEWYLDRIKELEKAIDILKNYKK